MPYVRVKLHWSVNVPFSRCCCQMVSSSMKSSNWGQGASPAKQNLSLWRGDSWWVASTQKEQIVIFPLEMLRLFQQFHFANEQWIYYIGRKWNEDGSRADVLCQHLRPQTLSQLLSEKCMMFPTETVIYQFEYMSANIGIHLPATKCEMKPTCKCCFTLDFLELWTPLTIVCQSFQEIFRNKKYTDEAVFEDTKTEQKKHCIFPWQVNKARTLWMLSFRMEKVLFPSALGSQPIGCNLQRRFCQNTEKALGTSYFSLSKLFKAFLKATVIHEFCQLQKDAITTT